MYPYSYQQPFDTGYHDLTNWADKNAITHVTLVEMTEWMNASQTRPNSTTQSGPPPFNPTFAFDPNNYQSTSNQPSNYSVPDYGGLNFGAWPGQQPAVQSSSQFNHPQSSHYQPPYIYSPNPYQSQLQPKPTTSPPPSLGAFPDFAHLAGVSAPGLGSQLATHVAALDAIGLLQVRLQQLKAVLNSAIHPPGSSLAGSPLGPEHCAKLTHEIANTATRQQALVVQVKHFVAQNGGDAAVQPAVLAFRLQQQQIQQQQANAQIQAALAGAGVAVGTGYPSFQANYNHFNSNPVAPSTTGQSTDSVSPQSSSTPVPPVLASIATAGGPVSPPVQSGTPPLGSLPPGLQAVMKARQAAKANAPPPPKPQLKKTPVSTSPPGNAIDPATLDGRTIAGLPRPRGLNSSTASDEAPSAAKKSATAQLTEPVPGLPTLTELHKQLKRDQFEASIKHVLAKEAVEMVDPVKIEGREVALWDMWQVVMVEGLGGESVDSNSSWAGMASHLKLPSSPVAAAALQAAYHAQLSVYEGKWSAALLRQRQQMMAARVFSSGAVSTAGARAGSSAGAGLRLQAEHAAAILGQGLWQHEPASSFPMPSAGDEGGRFEELADDSYQDDPSVDRRRKEPRPTAGPSGAVPPPTSQASPLLAADLAPLLPLSFDGLPDAPALPMPFGGVGGSAYDLSDLGAFTDVGGLGGADGAGMFAFEVGGEGTGGLSEGTFDFEQFLAGAGSGSGHPGMGEFEGEAGYPTWQ